MTSAGKWEWTSELWHFRELLTSSRGASGSTLQASRLCAAWAIKSSRLPSQCHFHIFFGRMANNARAGGIPVSPFFFFFTRPGCLDVFCKPPWAKRESSLVTNAPLITKYYCSREFLLACLPRAQQLSWTLRSRASSSS